MFINATLGNVDIFMGTLNQLHNLFNTKKLRSHSEEVTCNVQYLHNIENKLGSFLEIHTLMAVARESERSFSFNHLFCQSDASRCNMVEFFKSTS